MAYDSIALTTERIDSMESDIKAASLAVRIMALNFRLSEDARTDLMSLVRRLDSHCVNLACQRICQGKGEQHGETA